MLIHVAPNLVCFTARKFLRFCHAEFVTKSGGGASNKHLEIYLNEIHHRFKRRFWVRELLDRLIQACLSSKTITYAELVCSAPIRNNC